MRASVTNVYFSGAAVADAGAYAVAEVNGRRTGWVTKLDSYPISSTATPLLQPTLKLLFTKTTADADEISAGADEVSATFTASKYLVTTTDAYATSKNMLPLLMEPVWHTDITTTIGVYRFCHIP